MKTLATPATLTLDPLSIETSRSEVSPLAENLAPSECNAAVDSPFFSGNFVWAKVKGRPWWPALVSPPYEASDNVQWKKDSVLVACFGDGDTFTLSDSKLLKPFLEVFDEMSMQSSTKSFLSALDDCVEEVGRSLQLEITCHCVPVEDRPKTLRRATCAELPVANYSPREFLYCVLDVARDIQAVNMVDVLRLRSLVFAFGKFSMQGEDWTFHQRCSVEELVDKVDLDALPSETVSGKEEEKGLVSGCRIVKSPGLSTGTQQQGRRKSMQKLIAEMDLDTVEIEEEEEEQSLGSKKRKKGKLVVVKTEEEPSSSSGRRERKKSKYLSPPYTNLGEEGMFVDLLPMSLEGKTPRKAACFFDPGAAWSSAIVQCSTEEVENKSPLLKIEKMPAHDIFSEFVATTKNALHLKWNRFAGVVKFFFTMYRISMYSSGAEFEDYQKLVLEFFAENEYAVGKAEKPERADRNRKHGSCKGINLDFKLQKSNSKHGPDLESKLDSEVNCKYGTNLDNDMDSRQQKKDCSEKQKPRRKMLKEGTNQGFPVNSGLCLADISDEGKEKQKPGKIKISKDKTSQGALVDSNFLLPNVLDGGKKKQNSGKKKMLNDGVSNQALSHLNLNMGDASDEDKPGEGRKRCKIDVYGAAAVNVDLRMISSFPERDLEKMKTVSKDVANAENDVSLEVAPINCHKPASLDGKMIEIKKDVNCKSLQNLDEEEVKLREGGKSGRKKKNGTGPPKAKSRGRKSKKVESSYCSQAALHLTFHSGIVLPSIEDLIATYSKYGALIHNQIELLKESNSARVVFAKSTCAENAFKDRAGPYGSVATYRLLYLSENHITFLRPNSNLVFPSRRIPDAIPPSPQISDLKSAVCKPPLPYIRKSLETMISTLAWSSSLVNNAGSSSDVLNPEARDNLVGEMQGLLHKVDKMLNGQGSSSSD